MKAAPTDNTVTKLRDSEIIECIETDIGVQVTNHYKWKIIAEVSEKEDVTI